MSGLSHRIRGAPQALISNIVYEIHVPTLFSGLPYRSSFKRSNIRFNPLDLQAFLRTFMPLLMTDTFVGFMPWSGDSLTEATSADFNVCKYRTWHVVGCIEIEISCRSAVRVLGSVFFEPDE